MSPIPKSKKRGGEPFASSIYTTGENTDAEKEASARPAAGPSVRGDKEGQETPQTNTFSLPGKKENAFVSKGGLSTKKKTPKNPQNKTPHPRGEKEKSRP